MLLAIQPGTAEMTKNTSSGLKQSLSNVTDQLYALGLPQSPVDTSSEGDKTRHEGEYVKCRATCDQSNASIDKHWRKAACTATSLENCQEKPATTTSGLEEYIRFTEDERVCMAHCTAEIPNGQTVRPKQAGRKQKDIRYRRDTYESAAAQVQHAGTNVLENICVSDDGQQIITSTAGNLVVAKNISAGVGSTQCLGQLSDTSIQRLLATRSKFDD